MHRNIEIVATYFTGVQLVNTSLVLLQLMANGHKIESVHIASTASPVTSSVPNHKVSIPLITSNASPAKGLSNIQPKGVVDRSV